MASYRRAAGTLAAVLFTLTAAVSCDDLDKALDCVQTADAIASSADELDRTIDNVVENPDEAQKALDDIDKELDKLQDKTDDGELKDAVDKMSTAVKGVRSDIKGGDETPDITPVVEATAEIGDVCTS